LKQALADVKIFGPSGDPDAKADPTKYTMVPWEEVREHEAMQDSAAAAAAMAAGPDVPLSPVGGWNLSDKNAVISACFFWGIFFRVLFLDWFFLVGSSDDVLNTDSVSA
jgi:hypothetical protein